jgi:LmbE family N-acetylglucosaminyl deacetylase
MKGLSLARPGERLSVLCLGAHSDDVEIGAGGTILGWIAAGLRLEVVWCVLSASGTRAAEARNSAEIFLEGAASGRVVLGTFDDGLFPAQYRQIKAFLAEMRDVFTPDVVLTHCPDDAHQDHRTVCEITWNLFRDHVILEYEIPKWDGDLGRPSLYVPLTAATLETKIRLLEENFGTQRPKDWFDAETFRGLARLRGMECRAPERYAEAFRVRKLTLAI